MKEQSILRIKAINASSFPLPIRQSGGAAGYDLRAHLNEPARLLPLERCLIPTGLYLEIPAGYEAQIRPRSGLAWEAGLTVLNAPGTIDSDYRGEIKVLLINLGHKEYVIEPGERIAQLVFSQVLTIVLEQAPSLSPTLRGEKGIGHTGK